MVLRLAHYEGLSNYSLPPPHTSNGDESQRFLEMTWHIGTSSLRFGYRRSYSLEKKKYQMERRKKSFLTPSQNVFIQQKIPSSVVLK